MCLIAQKGKAPGDALHIRTPAGDVVQVHVPPGAVRSGMSYCVCVYYVACVLFTDATYMDE